MSPVPLTLLAHAPSSPLFLAVGRKGLCGVGRPERRPVVGPSAGDNPFLPLALFSSCRLTQGRSRPGWGTAGMRRLAIRSLASAFLASPGVWSWVTGSRRPPLSLSRDSSPPAKGLRPFCSLFFSFFLYFG